MTNQTINFELWETMIDEENNQSPKKDTWFICSFCKEIVTNKPSFMMGEQCVCSECKEYEEMINKIEKMNKVYEEGELIEMLCGEEEYRGDKKEKDKESFEDIDITLCYDFDKKNIFNGDSDDEE
jgi:acetyl-CoA carboxylase beta subunit